MQEISSIVSGQMLNQTLESKTVKPAVEGPNFLSIAKTAAASQLVIAGSGNLEQMNLKRKQEAGLGIFKNDEEEEDVFEVLENLRVIFERFCR